MPSFISSVVVVRRRRGAMRVFRPEDRRPSSNRGTPPMFLFDHHTAR
jgi:hypothetical protein